MTTEQRIETAHDKSKGLLLSENEIARLMQTYNLDRQQAESVLKRKGAPHVPQHIMERVSREEFEEFLKEISCSGEEVFTLGSSSRKDELDDE